ncbi:MAG: PilT/PilU family type 4a pilus ATPase [Verrucomicrobiaceae bacterium]|nr:MAG: PilT/PilU family type 4a pilus ATPase [Verrucomicrobiaceae bacterium]
MNVHPLLESLLAESSRLGASDLHLIGNLPASVRVNGEIMFIGSDTLSPEDLEAVAVTLLNPSQLEKFEIEWELCVSMNHDVAGRLRVTAYKHNGRIEFSFRFCGSEVYTREELGLPTKIDELARKPHGLVLVCGATGAGKTTTLNYMVNLINSERRCKIVTIEDPIEHVHRNQKAIVVQQELLTDTHSFRKALTHVLRQDPDVIVVGEMREPETIMTALTAAETGHLVLSTLHSPSTTQALERIIGIFEGSTQKQVILQLANSLQGIIVQQLLPAADRSHRVLAYEVLVANSAVRNIIREGQLHALENTLQTNAREGMNTMDACLLDLYQQTRITYDTALSRARHPAFMNKG